MIVNEHWPQQHGIMQALGNTVFEKLHFKYSHRGGPVKVQKLGRDKVHQKATLILEQWQKERQEDYPKSAVCLSYPPSFQSTGPFLAT